MNKADLVKRIIALRSENYSWNDIAQQITAETGKPYSKEAIRSVYRRSKSKYFRAEPELKANIEFSKLHGIIGFLKKENALLKKRLLSQEELFSILADEVFTNRKPLKLPPYKPPKKGAQLPERDIILLISDVQGGLLASKEKVLIGNYNFEVFKTRLIRYRDAILKTLEDFSKGHNITGVYVCFLGDIIEGHDVFSGQVYALEKYVIEQTLLIEEAFENLLIELYVGLTDTLKKTVPFKVFCVVGNHGQLGGRKGGMVLELNFDYGFYLFLKKCLQLRKLNITFEISKAPSLYFKSKNNIFQIIHGDEIRGWATFPFYGFEKFDARSIRYSEILHDYLLSGHWHAQASLSSGRGRRIINGCWCGATDLTAKNKLPSFPTQLVLVNSENYGITHEITIALDEFKRPEIQIYE